MSYLAAMGPFLGSAFLAPAAFAFLGLIPVVILLYLLKLRRTHVVISSTLLWHKSLQDLTANAPFQRLRRNLLLLLQIIVLILLAIALARPFIKAAGMAGNDLCLLVDTSASMQTLEDGRPRIELAKDKALDLVNTMGGGDKVMIVTFDKGAGVLCELTDNRAQLRRVIRSITASDCGTRVRDALLVANSLQATAPDLKTIILSDGRIADLDTIGSRAFDVDFFRVGAATNNAGLIAFSIRDPLEGIGERQCLVSVFNNRPQPLSTTLSLYWNDEALAVESVEAPAQGTTEIVFALADLDSGVLRAELDHEDALPVDNTAWLALRTPSILKVLLVAPGESTAAFFLKRVVALNPYVELSETSTENFSNDDDYDIIVFDNFAPETLPLGMLLFFNAVPPLPGLAVEGTLDNPSIIATDSEHPLMRFLNPSNVTITKARQLILPEGARSLISTTGGALVADVSRGGQEIIVVAFDLADSNWPLHLSFPLFVQNLIAWNPKSSMAAENSIVTGDPLTLMPALEVENATVILPDSTQETVELDPTRPVFFSNTRRAGVYSVVCGSQTEPYAVNLLDPLETAVTPADSLNIGQSEVAGKQDRIRQTRELWRWFIMAALCVLSLEWWLYSRRAWL